MISTFGFEKSSFDKIPDKMGGVTYLRLPKRAKPLSIKALALPYQNPSGI
jgi:hypothetical protein